MFTKKKKGIRRIAIAGLVLSVVCANTTPVFSKALAADGWTPLSLYFLTLLVMTLFLGVHEFMALESGAKWGMTHEDVVGTLLTTLTGGILSPILFFAGLSHVRASESVLITSILPLFIVIFACIFLAERFTKPTIVGGVFLLSGLTVLLLPDLLKARMSLGVPLLVGSSVFGAITTIIHKRYVKHRHLDSVVLVRTVISLLCMTIILAVLEPQSFELLVRPQRVWLVFGLPVVGFLMPYFLYFRALENVTAMEAGMVAGAGPVAGVILSALFLGETIVPVQLLSLGLVIAGILSINVPIGKLRIVPSRPGETGPLGR